MNLKAERKVLVVDDDQIIQKILKNIITQSGYEVILASSGEDAMAVIRNDIDEIDLVLLDSVMPNMQGIEVLQEIRSLPNGQLLPVIMVTANKDIESVVQALDAGADDYVTKPVCGEEVLARMRSTLRIRDLQEVIERKNQIAQEDLKAASRVQESLLPVNPLIRSGLEFSWVYKPSFFIGGDLINYQQIDSCRFLFYIVDVSGHGAAAAMFSFWLHNLLKVSGGAGILHQVVGEEGYVMYSPARICKKLDTLLNDAKMRYLTAFLGLIDLEEGILKYCRAGHPEPLVFHADGGISRLSEGNLPVGMNLEADYDDSFYHIQRGDRLLCFSDGITELPGDDEYLFGEEGFCREAFASRKFSVTQQLHHLFDVAVGLNGSDRFNDDISLLGISIDAPIR